MDKENKLYELAVKEPSAIVETEAEMLLRFRAQQIYFQTGYHDYRSAYEAGWKAAKAYYESK